MNFRYITIFKKNNIIQLIHNYIFIYLILFQKLEKERLKKEEELKKREADRIKKFTENPDEDNQIVDKFDVEAHISEELENKENDQSDEKKSGSKNVDQEQDNLNTSSDINDTMTKDKIDGKHKNEKLLKRDLHRSYGNRSSRRESRDRSKRRGSGRSRSRDRRRSRDRDYDRRNSRDRRNRRNYYPRRRDFYRINRPGRDNYRYYDRRNDYRKTNNSNSNHDTDINSSRYDKNRRKSDNTSDSNNQPKFKRRSRSTSSSSQHSKD